MSENFGDVFGRVFVKLSEKLEEAKKLIAILEAENSRLSTENNSIKEEIKELKK